jgi:hypothetical protein
VWEKFRRSNSADHVRYFILQLTLFFRLTTGPEILGNVGYLRGVPGSARYKTVHARVSFRWADATFAVALVNDGLYDPTKPGEEANLDMQYA